MSTVRVNGHTFFDRFISSDSVVLDLGANMGRFSLDMIAKFGCRCYAVEANPEVFKTIPQSERLKAFNFAVAKESGTLELNIAENSEASSLLAKEGKPSDHKVSVAAIRLDEFTKDQGLIAIDLLKMDIEGAEIQVLDSCSDEFLQNISQITLEFHDFAGIVTRDEVMRVIRRLTQLGFLAIQMSRPSHGNEDVCLINRNRCSVSSLEYLWTRYFSRNVRGAKRIIQRRLGRSVA